MKIKKNMWMILIAAVLLVSSTTGDLAQGRAKVNVCHVNGSGSFNLINVSESSLPAHLAHGDAVPGDAVPGMIGYDFSSDCTPLFNGTVVNVTSCVPGGHSFFIDSGEGLMLNFNVPGGIGTLVLNTYTQFLEPFYVNGVFYDGNNLVHDEFSNVTQLTYTIFIPATTYEGLGNYTMTCN